MTAWGLLLDFTTFRELISTLPGNSTLQKKALTIANATMTTFYKKDPESIPAACRLADEVFGDKWEERGVGIYEDEPKEARVWGIGHCHIDTAWYVKWIARR
jgi:alpha-mannosidase